MRAKVLESPDLSLRRKVWHIVEVLKLESEKRAQNADYQSYLQLLSARDMAQRTFIGKDKIVYSTDKDLIEQDYDKQEWDRRFKELENLNEK